MRLDDWEIVCTADNLPIAQSLTLFKERRPLYNLIALFQDRLPAMLDAIQLTVEQETPSDDKGRLDLFADYLAQMYHAVGAEVEIIPNLKPSPSGVLRGNHVRAVFVPNGADPDAKPALILCHFDTVWPVGSLVTHPFRIETGEDGVRRAYGPGIFDMQTSLVMVAEVLRAISAQDLAVPRPITVLMTSDEEVGSRTSRRLIEDEARKAAYVLVMESPLPGGVIKTRRKGSAHFELAIQGKAAHAGVEPEKGISAIQELAHQILALHGLTDMAAGTTVNVGVVSGGTRSNVVAADAHAVIDVRFWTAAEMDRVIAAIRGLTPIVPGTTLEVRGGSNRPPLERAVTGKLFRASPGHRGQDGPHPGRGGHRRRLRRQPDRGHRRPHPGRPWLPRPRRPRRPRTHRDRPPGRAHGVAGRVVVGNELAI